MRKGSASDSKLYQKRFHHLQICQYNKTPPTPAARNYSKFLSIIRGVFLFLVTAILDSKQQRNAALYLDPWAEMKWEGLAEAVAKNVLKIIVNF